MVQTRSVAAKIQLRQADGDGQWLPQDDAVETSSGEDAPSPVKKRRRLRGAESPKKRHRGKREELCKLNLDVLFLIAEYIHPMDLLNLARTCKPLRELLMDKSSEFVWKTARRQVPGLPACPADLTEPEYANLVFCARCHGCGKQARTVLWSMRRRYCPSCKRERLLELHKCNRIILDNDVLASEYVAIDKESSAWIDKEQMELFLGEYRKSTNQQQFLKEKREQKRAVSWHARSCESWQQGRALERRNDLAARREKREDSVFDRIEQYGYSAEIAYFGRSRVRDSHKAVFRTSKPLTDKEWDRMWPELRKTMDSCRLHRINTNVYQPRRRLLASEYSTYVTTRADGSTFDLLPHAIDLVHFGPFQDIIKAPEGTEMGDKPFAPAFAQLPDLIPEWKKKLDAELAELVKIPPDLSLEDPSDCQGKVLSSSGSPEASQLDLDKLHLACALFSVGGSGPYTHINALSVSMSERDFLYYELDVERTGSIQNRYRIEFLEEAPYIVRTCGLDPRVATVDDMDCRNARFRCLSCQHQANVIMNWRAAMWHANFHLKMSAPAPLSEMPRWLLVNDEHTEAIEAIEQSVPEKESALFSHTRCLLCPPRVGDASPYERSTVSHLVNRHKIEEEQVKRGVHYLHACINNARPKVEIVEGEKVTFRISGSP